MPKLKQTFGGCTFEGTSPKVANLSAQTPMLNLWMSFEKALKFSLAVQECVRKLNSYNRGAKAGRQTGLNVAVHLHKRRIKINERPCDAYALLTDTYTSPLRAQHGAAKRER